LIFLVGDLPPIPIHLAFGRPPAGGIDRRDDPMNPIGREEPILYASAQAVGVQGIAEVLVGIAVVLAQRRRRRPQLACRLKLLENLPPVALIAGAPAMTLVDDDEVEKVLGE